MNPNHNSRDPRDPCLDKNCSRCYNLFQSTNGFISQQPYQHNPYNPPPYNPHLLQTSQQRFADGNINMYQTHNNVRTDPHVVVQNQVRRPVHQHCQDNTMNRNTSYVPDAFINHPFTNEARNAYLQRSASVPITVSYPNTACNNIPHSQIRNDHQNAHITARSNVAASTSQFQPNRPFNLIPTFIAPIEVNGRLNTNNNKTYVNVENKNMPEFQDLHNTKRFKNSNFTFSSEYANKNNDGQTIIDNSSKRQSVVAKDQNNKSTSSSKTKKRSNSKSLKEDDVSDDDILVIDENKTTQQKPKTIKQIQPSSSREERVQFNSSDSDQSITFNTFKKIIQFLNQTIDKSKTEPKQKLFKCRTCPKLFVEKKQLRKHLSKKFHNHKGKNCNKCQLKFSKKSINEHVKQHHNDERNLTQGDFDIVTDLSSSSSSDSSDSESSTSSDSSERRDSANPIISPNSSLKSHKPISSEERQVKQIKRKNPESLKISLNIQNLFGKNKKFRISDAEKPNASSSHNSHTFVVFKCAKCEKCFYRVDIDRHKGFCGQSKILQCDLCPLKFAHRSLVKHQREHHSTTTLNTINLIIMENNENNSVKTETLTLAKRKEKYSVNGIQKVSSHSKFVSNIMNKQKKKITMTKKLLQTTYQSYSETIYKCSICNICFATAPTMQSHINQNNHAMPTVRRCSICKLSFSNVVLERHHRFHHGHLKLEKKSDFIIKVRPILRVKTGIPKNILNSKKPIVSTVNNKISHTDPNKESSLQKKEGVSEENLKQRHESDQSQNRDVQKEPSPEIPKNNSNQDQSISITELDLKDVNTLYKCSQCNLYFMENTYFRNHLAANHKLLIETYYCTFCNYTYCVSIESFNLHFNMHFKHKSIHNLIVNSDTITVDTTQTSHIDRNNDKLKECVINLNTAVTKNHSETNKNNLLLKNNIQGRLKDNISNDNQKPIKILSNIVLNQPITKDYQQADDSNESQSKNTLKGTAIDKKYKTLTNTDTNQVYNIKEQTPLILGDSNTIKDGDDIHEKCKRNFEKHHSINGSVVNLINKESETVDGCDSQRIPTSSHTTESGGEPEQWYQNKHNANFGDVKNVDPKNKEVSEIGPKLNNDMPLSTEELIKLLEGYPNQETTKPDELLQYIKLERVLNDKTEAFVTKHAVTVTERDEAFVATNQSKTGYFYVKSHTSIPVQIPSGSNETYSLNKKIANISENIAEIKTTDYDKPVKNEHYIPFLEDHYESNMESDSKDVIKPNLDKQPIIIKFRKTKLTAVTSFSSPDLATSNESVDYEISDTNTDKRNIHCQRDIVTKTMNDDDFQRDVAYVKNMIENIQEETDDETSSSSDE